MKLAPALLSLMLAASSFAQTTAPTSKPTSMPAPPPMTAEQKAIADKINKAPSDMPMAKMDLNAYNKDNTPNPNFGKPNTGFVANHNNFMKRKEKPIDVLFLGDSITAGWGGKTPTGGAKVWEEHYSKMNPANFGIGGDRTQHVLWRIQEGELDGIKPKVVVLMIGTNNSGASAEEITKGVKAIITQIHTKLPDSKLLLLGIFPRGERGTGKLIPATDNKLQAVNSELAKLDDGKQTRYLEIRKPFLSADGGSIPLDVMPDALHPNEKGYQIWAESMQPLLDEMMK